jgi:4-hydroxybenzoate polyprenyltransferase
MSAGRRAGARDLVLGLVLGCHPLPGVAVTVFAATYAAAIGAGAGQVISIAVAFLAGQTCIGWSNDAIDAPRDVAARRADKPVSAGLVDRRTLAVAASVAALACVALSLRLGAVAGGLHLVAVISAIGYNAWLKTTWLSPLPYLVSFGLLPVVVSFAVTGPAGLSGPPWSHVVAAILLGAAAHAGNTVGDSEADALTGVRGLPQRLGPQRSLIAMAVLVAAAAMVLLVTVLTTDLSVARQVPAVVLLVAGIVLAAVGAVRRVGVPGGPTSIPDGAWRLTLVAVTLVIAGVLAAI